jgi:hypothetical protein
MNYPQPASLGWGFCRFVEISCLNPPQFLAVGIEQDSPQLRMLVPNAQDNISIGAFLFLSLKSLSFDCVGENSFRFLILSKTTFATVSSKY